MAAQDIRSGFRDVSVADPDMQILYRVISGGTGATQIDATTGVKTLGNLPKGTRIIDAKVTVVTVAAGGATYTAALDVNDGTTTTTVIGAIDGKTAVATFRVTGTSSGHALMAAAGTFRLNVSVSDVTTAPTLLISLIVVRENAI